MTKYVRIPLHFYTFRPKRIQMSSLKNVQDNSQSFNNDKVRDEFKCVP
jgi:hypothetical protein